MNTHKTGDKESKSLSPVLESRGEESWYLVGASCNNSCVECVADHGRFLGWPAQGERLPVPSKNQVEIFIGGREPTFVSRLEKIIDGLKRKGWTRVGLIGNGVQLNKPGVADALIKLGVTEVRVKLFDSVESRADAYASLDGAHGNSLAALKALASFEGASFSVQPLVIVHQGNVERVEEVFSYAVSVSPGAGFVAVPSPELYRSLPPGDRRPLLAELKQVAQRAGGRLVPPAVDEEGELGLAPKAELRPGSDEKRLTELPIPDESPKLPPPLRAVPSDPEERWEFARSLTARMRCGDDLPFLDVDGEWTKPAALLKTWEAFADRHKKDPAKRPLGIYAHMPYCTVKCSFCQDFAWALGSSSKLDDHVEGLLAEMEIFEPVLGEVRPVSFYFGGGTPSLLTPKHFERVFERLHSYCDFAEDAQICVEGNPASFDLERAKTLRSLGSTGSAWVCRL